MVGEVESVETVEYAVTRCSDSWRDDGWGIYYNKLLLPRSYLIGAFLPQAQDWPCFFLVVIPSRPSSLAKIPCAHANRKGWLQIHDVTRRGDQLLGS